ncbi:hypothetical protein Tsp_04489 [Trichinella spiralis]|uniref:hypothetical protein n=1 Tax=Trichinella spiralis TaxID=6334 RepID=UPI0001EFECD9|nr:hypothetical protein Tsp_04489 [Trichinella spiralis]
MVQGGPRLFDVEKTAQLPDNPRFERATLVTVQAVRRAKVRYVFLHQYFGHCVGFHVSKRECGCPLGKVVRQDQDISVARRAAPRCPFPLAAADNLQSLAASVHGCFLTAFFSPHTACTCGTIRVRPYSSRASKIGFWSWRGSAVRLGDPRIDCCAGIA